MSTSNQQALTSVERRQIGNVIAALVFSGCAVVGLSLASRRSSFIRRRLLRSPQWRGRMACAMFMGCYQLLSRLSPREEEAPEALETPELSEPAEG
jgi:hypothetical protein